MKKSYLHFSSAFNVPTVLLPLMLFSCPCNASAATHPAGGASDALVTEQIVVTAGRYPEGISSAPSQVTVIEEEEIRRSAARDIPELLRTVAAVQVSDIAGNRRHFTLDLRGFGETASLNTLVLIDGRPVNQADLSGIDWMLIPLERVERIEILHGGGGSVLYGDHAAGGVIHIITREAGASGTTVQAAAGSYDTWRGTASLDRVWEGFSLSLSAGYRSSDGYRDNSETEAVDLGLNMAYYPTDELRIHLGGWFHDDESGLPGALRESDFAAGFTRRETVNPEDFTEVEDYSVKGGTEFSFGREDSLALDLWYRERDVSTFASFAGGNFRSDTLIDIVGLSSQVLLHREFDSLASRLTLGADYRDAGEEIANESLFFGEMTTGSFDLGRENYGLFAQEEVTVKDRVVLSGGYRYDRAEFSFRPSTPDSLSMDENLYTAGLNYTYHGPSFAYISYSRSFRYPVLDEVFNFFTNTITLDLDSQRTDGFEAGIRQYLGEIAYLHVNLFRSETEKEIFFNPAAFTNENLDGEARRTGVEISFDVRPRGWPAFGGSYAYVDSTIDGGQFDGNDVPNVPAHKAALRAVVTPGKGCTAVFEGSYVGERSFVSDFGGDFDNQDDYFLLNVKLEHKWKNLTTFLALNNVTGSEYSEYGVLGSTPLEKAFFPSPGRNVSVGASFHF